MLPPTSMPVRAAACVAMLALGAAPAAAQTMPYPERPVRLVVGFPPGGATDTIARIIAPRLHNALGQPWIIDNRGGAGGALATEIVARSNPDGHTVLLVVSSSITSTPLLYKVAVNAERELEPVVLMTTAQYMLTVHASVKAMTVREFVDLAKAQPGKINYASTGIGTPQHLAAELFKMRAGIDLNHVPYKGGGPASVALLANEVPVMFGSLPALLQHVRTGRLRALAVTALKRAGVAPEIPTVAESGYDGFEITSWYGLMVRKQTPAAIVDKLHRAGEGVLQMPDVREAIQREGLEITIKAPREFARHIKAELDVMEKVVKGAKIRVN
jgi:tripartite-type tricarboxylate transporter receptor subunit TctC